MQTILHNNLLLFISLLLIAYILGVITSRIKQVKKNDYYLKSVHFMVEQLYDRMNEQDKNINLPK